MTSTNFLYQDVVNAARKQVADDAGRRWSDGDIELLLLPKVLAQLRADRPDLFVGIYATFNPRPALTDAITFDDSAFNVLVEALVASVASVDEESTSSGQSAAADALSERARRT